MKRLLGYENQNTYQYIENTIMIKNPFIEDSEIEFQTVISKKRLIEEYKKNLDIDINEIVSSIDRIELIKCKKSGYKFFHPFHIGGDSKFYEKLQEFDWYYMPWKWEHEVCSNLINEGNKILEVGCGTGDFLEKIGNQYQNIQCIGLELNENSIVSRKKYKILNRKIEDYSIENEGRFDIVCSFQVLEHISAVNSFLSGKIRCLKENGLLVICVPNNDSFIKEAKFNYMNMPPHHMGLWTEKSLKMIGDEFNLEFVKVEYEPLQEHHFDWYIKVKIEKAFGEYVGKYILEIFRRIKLNKSLRKYIENRASKIHGHSILIVFKKTKPVG